MPGRIALVAALAIALSGCGSLAASELPPPAQPRISPALEVAPAGRVVAVGGATRAPEGLAFDPVSGVLAVGLRHPAQLALLDGATGRLLRRAALPAAPRHVTAADGVFHVPAEAADRLVAVRARDARVLSVMPVGRRPHGVAAGAGSLAVGARGEAALDLVDRGGSTRQVPVAAEPGGVIALDGGRYAVVSERERVVEVFDASGARVAREPAGVGPTHGAYRDEVLWVTDTQGDALLVFRVEPELQLTRRLRLRTGPYGIALDPVAERLWVTLTGDNRVVELPAHGRPHVLDSYPTVRQPDDVAVDSRTGRVFVGGRADGVVQMIDPRDAPAMRRAKGIGER